MSTSAGGEGINLQVCHVLFNYDLPWNPMAIEQRIGRIHRYGQHDTVQVYNLVAEDTVEQRIYDLLDEKLLTIARAIGKVDTATGTVVEDFRGDILGLLGSAPNYQELYKKALIDRDYKRTGDEIAKMLETAARASQALQSLTQDLTAFNLEHYRSLQGELNLDDLRAFVERAVLRLGGTFIPDNEFYRIETPKALLAYRNVAARYDTACFVRGVAMRKKNADLMGIGHPLVDAIIGHIGHSSWAGDVTAMRAIDDRSYCSARWVVEGTLENGTVRRSYESAKIAADESWQTGTAKDDLRLMSGSSSPETHAEFPLHPSTIKTRIEAAIVDSEARFRAEHRDVQSVRARLFGVAFSVR